MNNRHFTYDDVMNSLETIFYRNRDFCKFDVQYEVNPFSDNGDTIYDVMHPVGSRFYEPMVVRVGIKTLEKEISNDGFVRDEDAVKTIFKAFHESAHVWQCSVVYMQNSGNTKKYLKNMAKDRVIDLCFPEYGHMAYVLNTSELFADRYGVVQTSNFFKELSQSGSCICDINVDKILCDFCKQRHGPSWQYIRRSRTVDDLYKAYTNALVVAPYRKKTDMNYLSNVPVTNACTKRLLSNDTIMTSILEAEDGVMESDILCDYIGTYYPSCFRSLLCIKQDYCRTNVRNRIENVIDFGLNVTVQAWSDLDGQMYDTFDESLPSEYD